jgi:zinc transport system substrate-binding protein
MFRPMRRHVWILIAIGLSLSLASCGGKKAASGKPRVAVSIFPLYDVTKRIAGDRLDVILVLPPGKSEHGYDPTPKEIARLERAKLGISVGLDMDTWVEDIMKNAGGVPKMLRVGDKVKTIPIDVEPIEPEAHAKPEQPAKPEQKHDHEHEHEHEGEGSGEKHDEDKEGHDDHDDHEHHVGAPDPHVWLDPERMITIVEAITAELVAVDAAGKQTFETNAATLETQLKALDAELAKRMQALTKKTIVTFHGSMSYFAKRYGLVIAAVVEPIAGKEPTATYLAEVIEAIKNNNAAALFTEPQLDRGPGETIAKEAKVPLGELDPVGGTQGRDSYEALMRWNADQLEKVLK